MNTAAPDYLEQLVGGKSRPKLRDRKCRICKTPFRPARAAQYVCGEACAIQEAARLAAKKQREAERRANRDLAARRLALRSLTDWLNAAQQPFNTWIRHRDRGLPCISCGAQISGQGMRRKGQAGHFLSIQSHPELRFCEENVHMQCVQCNKSRGGNHHYFRLGLLEKEGPEVVARLEGPRRPHQFTIAEAQQIIATYRAKLKE